MALNRLGWGSALFLVLGACAAPINNDDDGGGTGGAAATGGTGGGTAETGGASNTGGASPTTGGATNTGGGFITTGGAMNTGGAGVGGTMPTTGGATGTGGTTGGVTCTGSAWAVSDGYVDDGTWCGYGFTTAWGDATVMPAEFGAGDTEFCVTGNVPAEVPADEAYHGLMIGFDVKSDGTTSETWPASGAGLTVAYTATGLSTEAGTVRVMVKTKTGPTDGYSFWAGAGATGSVTATWAQFTDAPWDPASATATMSANEEVTQIGIQVGGREMDPQPAVELCLTSITRN